MEKEPTLIEQKFEDAVKNFRQEMEKGKESMQYVLCKLQIILSELKTPEEVARLRGKSVEEILG